MVARIFAWLLVSATASASLLTAELDGFAPYNFYRDGKLSVSTEVAGSIEIDSVTGVSVLLVRLTLTGGPDVVEFGLPGEVFSGSTVAEMAPAVASQLWIALEALPDQPLGEWWGTDHAAMLMFDHVGCLTVGPFVIGCGPGASMPMLLAYRYQGRSMLNYWADWSGDSRGNRYWSGDMVMYADPKHTPEPAGLVGAGIVSLALLRWWWSRR